MKYAQHASMDLALNDIKNNGNRLHLLSQAPGLTGGIPNYADVATYSLGNVALASGDFTVQDGAVSGRRITVAQKTVTGSAGGTAVCAVVIDTGNTVIKAVTTCPSFTVTNGVAFVVAAYDAWEIQDPT